MVSQITLQPLPPPDADFSTRLPTQDDLPCDDGIPMETPRHGFQMTLLIDALQGWLRVRGRGFAGGNMFLYYSLEQIRHRDFMGPDFFVVLDVPLGERKSWVVWEQGRAPDLVVELLSDSTARYDKTGKKALYAQQVHVPEYYWYDPFNPKDFAGFTLVGAEYQPLSPDSQGRILSPSLQLYLGTWEGVYMGVEATWLRWFTPAGELLPNKDESAEQKASAAKQEASAAKQEAAQAAERAARLAEQLRKLGVNPDSF
jgi:Uma2 family endonuclease